MSGFVFSQSRRVALFVVFCATCLYVTVTAGGKEQPQIPRIKASNLVELRKFVGKPVVVFGKVAATSTSKSGHNFLNMEGKALTVVCFSDNVKKFVTGKPADLFKGKNVEVSGALKDYKGKLQLELSKPAQIKIVAATASGKAKSVKPVELKQVRKGVYVSPAGLVYQGRDPMGLSRVDHVRRHMKDIPGRAGPHGVFTGPEGIAWAIIDEAWLLAEKRKIKPRTERDRSTVTVSMGRPIGFLGGELGAKRNFPELSRVFIVFESKTKNIITAFPK